LDQPTKEEAGAELTLHREGSVLAASKKEKHMGRKNCYVTVKRIIRNIELVEIADDGDQGITLEPGRRVIITNPSVIKKLRDNGCIVDETTFEKLVVERAAQRELEEKAARALAGDGESQGYEKKPEPAGAGASSWAGGNDE